MPGLYRDKYVDFTVKHVHEQLQKRHGYVLGYTVTKLALHAAGLVRKAPKRLRRRAFAATDLKNPSDHCIKQRDRQNSETRTGLLVLVSRPLRRPCETRRPCSV